MTTTTLPAASEPTAAPGSGRRGRLALALQEAFTAAVRLRGNRQAAVDAESFRRHIKQLLAAGADEARAAGYRDQDVRLAVYAFIVFLDESVLNSSQPIFSHWPRQPLQEEVFGHHRGGETFFHNLDTLLGLQDSEDLADVLEVYQLALLLGFRGKYGTSRAGEVDQLSRRVHDKILRIRGVPGPLAPSWAPPEDELVPERSDPWLRRLAAAAGSTFVVALVLYLVYFFILRADILEVEALASRILP